MDPSEGLILPPIQPVNEVNIVYSLNPHRVFPPIQPVNEVKRLCDVVSGAPVQRPSV
ncbi:hypothetical protein HanPI659440_Chr03g0098861 [Helianthus annuus]|nr:hypothetical protein HanPI659440_Chr03g0098861 [Helianthus annuus]